MNLSILSKLGFQSNKRYVHVSDVCSRPCPPGLAIRFGLANCLIHIDKRRATGVHAPDMANIACILKLNVVHVLLTITMFICDRCRRNNVRWFETGVSFWVLDGVI